MSINIIPIAFICEEGKIKPLSVALVSLLENADKSTKYKINILNKTSYSQENIDIILNLKDKYNCNINFVDIDNKCDSIEDISKTIANKLTENKRCIYLDYNVVIQKDLVELFNFELIDSTIGAVKQIDDEFNSSVLLIDCDKVRKNNISIGEIDLKFNLQAYLLKGEKSFNFAKQVEIKGDLVSKFDKKQLKSALRENVIFSYSDEVNPFTSSDCCFYQEWWKYFRISTLLKQDKNEPKVSVVIPVYNVEKYIRECLDSVINQTLQDIEIILVDDGSTDNSMEIMQEYANLDNRIKILQQENQGAGCARNKGLDIAKGKYLSFLDPDDFFELTMLEQTYNKAIETDVDIVVFDFTIFEQNLNKFMPLKRKSPTDKEVFSYKDIPNHIFGGLHHNAWTKLYKTEFVKSNNIKFQHLFRVNDIFFVHTSIVQAKSITYLNKPLAYYRTGMKDNSQATLYKHPLSFYEAELAICEKLKEVGVYNEVEKSFLNSLLGIAIDNLNRVNDKDGAKIIYNHIKENLDKDFGITNHPKEFYSTKFYDMFMMIRKVSFEYYIEMKNNNQPIRKDYNYYKNLSPEFYEEELKEWYKNRTGETLDLDNPRTFNEKIQWLKLYDSTPLKTQLADKYLVRDWIKQQIGEEYLIPLLGVWDSFDEIDFDKLPNQFALKTNHGSGCNFIVKDKSKFDKAEAKKKFDVWMKLNFAFINGFELHYMKIKPKIIAEKFIQNIDVLFDYRLFSFYGKTNYIWIDIGSGTNEHKRNVYNKKWELQNHSSNYGSIEKQIDKPKQLDTLLYLVEKLNENFAFSRTDFYIIDEKIYFGEITFTPQSGVGEWVSKDVNKEYGELIYLPR